MFLEEGSCGLGAGPALSGSVRFRSAQLRNAPEGGGLSGHPVLVGGDAIRCPLGMVGGEFAGDAEAGFFEDGSLGVVVEIGEVAIAADSSRVMLPKR